MKRYRCQYKLSTDITDNKQEVGESLRRVKRFPYMRLGERAQETRFVQ